MSSVSGETLFLIADAEAGTSWRHAALARGGTGKAYLLLDGAMADSADAEWNVVDSAEDFRIGASGLTATAPDWMAYPFDGLVDEVRISGIDRSDSLGETAVDYVYNDTTVRPLVEQ